MQKYLTFPIVIRIGLACAFLANSLTAFLAPAEFQELISASFVSGLLPVSVATFVTFIGLNDLTVAALLVSGWRTKEVALYATLWLLGVIVVIGVVSFDALEHLAFLAMSLSLVMRGNSRA